MSSYRHRSRDPRSVLEIRRLALRAKRSEAARQVLVDALWETYPREFQSAIDSAKKRAARDARSGYRIQYLVTFSPRWLSKHKDFHTGAIHFSAVPEQAERSRQFQEGTDVIVYRVQPPKARTALYEPKSGETFRVAYVGEGARRTVVDANFTSLDRAAQYRRKLKNRGMTAWIETPRGEFVPVTGATKRPGYRT